MLKLWAFITTLFFTLKSFANPACAVCTVAIGASLEIARQLGVDDCVIGVWAGAFLSILGYWAIRWFDKKGWAFYGRDWMLMILSIATIGFVYINELTYKPIIIGIFYMDSFLFATITGALSFIIGMKFYEWMKMKNGGHAHFPFEKVVVPFLIVLIVSLIFNYASICNCKELYDF